jgi:RimJ/RimL family protein N-acetyltransferase
MVLKNMNITFKKANPTHQELIFSWLNEPHIIEFWDNSQAHKDDIINFIHNRKQHYFYGTAIYWLGLIDDEPYSFIISDIFQYYQELPELHRKNLSKSGHTIRLDFAIGNKKYLGQGLAALTLQKFVSFYQESVDSLANVFFIDPDQNNSRAHHVYNKAGFELVGDLDISKGDSLENASQLRVKRLF